MVYGSEAGKLIEVVVTHVETPEPEPRVIHVEVQEYIGPKFIEVLVNVVETPKPEPRVIRVPVKKAEPGVNGVCFDEVA
jgi:hypothetical protein